MGTVASNIEKIQKDPFFQESIAELYPELMQKITLKHWLIAHRKQANEPTDKEFTELMNLFEQQKEKIYTNELIHG